MFLHQSGAIVMTSHPRRRHQLAVRLLGLASLAVACTPAVLAQNTAGDDAYWARITTDDVYVRAGAGDSYYPFGKVGEGDFVKIVGRKFDWMRIVTTGPTFADFFGYVRYPADDTRIFAVGSDGKTGRTLGRVDLLAPNHNTDYDPAQSWKRILDLPPGTQLTILETMQGDNRIVHKVKLPPDAEGWISNRFVERADPQAVAAWMASQAPTNPPAAKPPSPAETGPTAKSDEQPEKPEPSSALGRDEPSIEPPTPPADETDRTDASQADQAPEEPGQASAPAANQEQAIQMGGEDESPDNTDDAGKAPPTPAERLANLDEIYNELRDEPIETAEVLPLRDLYLELIEDARAERANAVARYALARARQLELWSELQQQRREIAELRGQVASTKQETDAARRAVEEGGPYAGVGRLVASTVYDGRRLPKLFRLQDPGSGRTIAYLRPSEQFDLERMLSRLIGVVGEKQYDGGLRLDLIRPVRIDELTPSPR
jgi:hypothetical protein